MALPVSALNHLLAQNPWARERLAPFAGRVFGLDAFPLPRLNFAIAPDGSVTEPRGQMPDTVLSATPDALLRFLLIEPHERYLVRIHGDHALGEVLMDVLPRLEWEAEEDLSRLFGDVLGYRLARFGRDLLRWQQESVLSAARAAAEYLTEEKPLLVNRGQLGRLAQEVAETAAAVDSLEQRIDRLTLGEGRG
jgi:ubiquinone biosynthesis protein UbiJ